MCSGGALPLTFCIHVHSGPIYGGGVIYLAEKIIRWWYFTRKKPENILCVCILHVNMFHYFKIPYITCTFFLQNLPAMNILDLIYFLSHVVSKFFASAPPWDNYQFSLSSSCITIFACNMKRAITNTCGLHLNPLHVISMTYTSSNRSICIHMVCTIYMVYVSRLKCMYTFWIGPNFIHTFRLTQNPTTRSQNQMVTYGGEVHWIL